MRCWRLQDYHSHRMVAPAVMHLADSERASSLCAISLLRANAASGGAERRGGQHTAAPASSLTSLRKNIRYQAQQLGEKPSSAQARCWRRGRARRAPQQHPAQV